MSSSHWPAADAAACDAVLNALQGRTASEALSALARSAALLISNHAALQDEVLHLLQARIASELRCQQMARAAIQAAKRGYP